VHIPMAEVAPQELGDIIPVPSKMMSEILMQIKNKDEDRQPLAIEIIEDQLEPMEGIESQDGLVEKSAQMEPMLAISKGISIPSSSSKALTIIPETPVLQSLDEHEFLVREWISSTLPKKKKVEIHLDDDDLQRLDLAHSSKTN
ncbi:hypothetical protein KI387_000440, partial [Taxus chinensis]